MLLRVLHRFTAWVNRVTADRDQVVPEAKGCDWHNYFRLKAEFAQVSNYENLFPESVSFIRRFLTMVERVYTPEHIEQVRRMLFPK